MLFFLAIIKILRNELGSIYLNNPQYMKTLILNPDIHALKCMLVCMHVRVHLYTQRAVEFQSLQALVFLYQTQCCAVNASERLSQLLNKILEWHMDLKTRHQFHFLP